MGLTTCSAFLQENLACAMRPAVYFVFLASKRYVSDIQK
jgi:hypothetical protein